MSLGFDPKAAVAHLKKADPVMGRLIKKSGDFTLSLKKTEGTFEALLEAIVYQQLNRKAAATILGRFKALFDSKNPLSPQNLIAMSETAMRGAGLSRGKTIALKDLAAKTLEGTVPHLKQARKLSDEELIERLTAVHGIGEWTVHMLLIFRLGRPDVLPTGDFAIRKAFGQVYNKRKPQTPEQITKHGELWRPYRSMASWYLWRSLD